MKRRTVVLKRPAFEQIIASAYSLPKVEVGGFLSGAIRGNNFYVNNVHLHQIAERSNKELEIDKNEEQRLFEILNIVGAFHSHPHGRNGDKGNVFLSKADFKFMLESYPTGVEVIIALNKAERRTGVKVEDYKITGCIDRNCQLYRASISAYYLETPHRSRRAEVRVERGILEKLFFH
jgi:proteasome lid subunit RPN8/RPN11